MSDYSNADIQRMHDENVRTTHALLAPFRWAGYFLRAIVIVLICVVWVFVKNVGWLVNFGPLSQGDRQEKISNLYADADDAMRNMSENKCGRFEIDLSSPEPQMKFDDGNAGPPNYGQLVDDEVQRPQTELMDTAPGPWSDRSDRSFERKSARMYIAFLTAMDAVNSLRETLHEIKHVPASRIRIPDAPAFGFRAQQVMFLSHYRDSYGNPPMLVTGMCLLSECEPGDFMFSTSKFGDLFGDVIPLTPHQENAVAALMNTESDSFWVHTAHENGIYGQDTAIRAQAEQFREMRPY